MSLFHIKQFTTEMDNMRQNDRKEPEIVYSRSVKAGRRIYYLDVKKARNADLYICITESKKKSMEAEEAPVFEKHKLFLYKEDFAHFLEGLEDVVGYVKQQFGEIEDRQEWVRDEDEGERPAEEEEALEDDKPKRGIFGLFGK